MNQIIKRYDMNKNDGSISKMLVRIGAINLKNVEIFSTKTRDNKKLNVYRGKLTKVIFIDNFYYAIISR